MTIIESDHGANAAGIGSSIEYADMLLLRFGEFILKGKTAAGSKKQCSVM